MATGDKFLECVWPFCRVGTERAKINIGVTLESATGVLLDHCNMNYTWITKPCIIKGTDDAWIMHICSIASVAFLNTPSV